MRVLLTALLLSVSAPAWADNIAGCEVVLMEQIKQEDGEGVTEVASFRPAADFIASIYSEEEEVLREIDGLPIRAIMCKRQSVVPSLRDFPIIATGTPFMISQNFDSTESGLTTIYFKDGEFRSDYKGEDLDADTQAEMTDRLEVFNLQPHDLAEKEKAMLAETKDVPKDQDEPSETPSNEKTEAPTTDDAIEDLSDKGLSDIVELSTDTVNSEDDTLPESAETEQAPAEADMEALTPEELKDAE